METKCFLRILISLAVVLILFNGCAIAPRYVSPGKSDSAREKKIEKPATGQYIQTGMASYYAEKFQGRKTASGEIYNMNKFTAAHRSLPFNTEIKVTNLENSRSVIVRVNDRGPFAKGRIIDLSKAAASQIGLLRKGVGKVRVELTGSGGKKR